MAKVNHFDLSSFSFGLLLVGSLMGANHASAASSVGSISQRVIRALSIQRVSDLDFGSAAPGDGPKTVSPGTSENQENASFLVRGEPSQCYQVILPSDGTIALTHEDGDASRGRIAINAFRSYPDSTGTLDGIGRQLLYVGATRSAISETLRSGLYTGVFTVAVVY